MLDRSETPLRPATRRGSAVPYAVAGVLAAAAGTAAGHLVAGLVDPATSPVLAVGSTLIDLTPTPVKDWAIATFGTNDKLVLLSSVGVVTLVLAAVAGILSRRRRAIGVGLIVLLVVLAGAAALTRPTAGPLDALPALATLVVGIAALLLLLREADRATAPAPTSGTSRRGFLLGAGGVTLGALVLGGVGQRLGSRTVDPSKVALPTPQSAATPLPTGLEKTVPGISPFRTPTASFYRVDTNLTVPQVSTAGWSLAIDGDVGNPFTLSFDELLAMPMIERDITMTCVSNEVGGGYIGAATWQGVRLTDLLDRAKVGSTADQILSTAVDGFTISTPLDVARDGRDAMVAVAMNGAPLTDVHGFPARLITPGLYGFVGATKWLTRLTLTTYAAQQAYWTKRQWATDAPIKISSRIDTPRGLQSIPAGRTVIGGVAWAQHRGVKGVEVQIDDGEWQPAKLGPDAGVDYWRQWYLPWDATSGQHTLAVRATDLQGQVQTADRATPFPSGSSGIQSIVVLVS